VTDRLEEIRHAFTHRLVIIDDVDDCLLLSHVTRPDLVKQHARAA
jgi:hypothetical protein